MTAGRPILDARRVRSAVAYCLRKEHLRRTVAIALVVGTLLTVVNQGDVILSSQANLGTWLKAGTNFAIPFLVSNLGLLSGRPALVGRGARPRPGDAASGDDPGRSM